MHNSWNYGHPSNSNNGYTNFNPNYHYYPQQVQPPQLQRYPLLPNVTQNGNNFIHYTPQRAPQQYQQQYHPQVVQQQQRPRFDGIFAIPAPPPPLPMKRSYYSPTLTTDTFDAQEEFSEKLIAYARFNRNNDLMKNIMSDTIVPGVGVIDINRVQILKEQVDALKTHQKKISGDIDVIKEQFAVKKRKAIDDAEEFQSKYLKMCEPIVVEPEVMVEMEQRYYEAMKKHFEMQRWEKTLEWAKQTAAASATSTSDTDPLLAEILASPSSAPRSGSNEETGELVIEESIKIY